jgi:FtsP/CotA-like multicopper oxidase with cupredoxin domain
MDGDPGYYNTSVMTVRNSWVLAIAALIIPAFAAAQNGGAEVCPRPAAGSVMTAPREIRSRRGILRVALSLRSSAGPGGELRYCYVDEGGQQSPTLRVKPGDLLILKLKNQVPRASSMKSPAGRAGCASSLSLEMHATSTNLHFHGLMIPPACHQDDVLKTTIQAGGSFYEYRFRIPRSQPPGLYWYHPHPHGHSEEQVLGGASGALIVEGIEGFNRLVAGLPERLLVIRDQIRDQATPSAAPLAANLKPPSKDLSVNFIPVPYPDYPPVIIQTKPSQREFWRVLNASADTFVDLHLLTNGHWQSMGVVSLDGVSLGYEDADGNRVEWRQNVFLPPGGRAEFLFDGPELGGHAELLAGGVDTVPTQDEDEAPPGAGSTAPADDDDYTPARWLAKIVPMADAPEAASIIAKAAPVAKATSQLKGRVAAPLISPPLIKVRPVRERKLYFSEKVMDAKNPHGSTIFYVTEEGHAPSAFDPAAAPNITVRQGEVEDWIIENRSQEIHSFHIHQTHFIVLERDSADVEENYLRDSVELPFWDGVSRDYPSVKVRIDFRNPAIAGTFPYHCHILQHEDGGMMGTIRVVKGATKK